MSFKEEVQKTCACGCGKIFMTKSTIKRFYSGSCKSKCYQRRRTVILKATFDKDIADMKTYLSKIKPLKVSLRYIKEGNKQRLAI